MNTLANFIQQNVNNSNLMSQWDFKDRDFIFNTIYRHTPIENADEFLNELKSDLTRQKVVRNHDISLKREEARGRINEPMSGDIFIDENGEALRLVRIYDGHFQFCYDGSFHMNQNGGASMSGGFRGAKIDGKDDVWSIKADRLIKVKQKEKESKRFWFFMDNSAGGNRGLYFYSKVNSFKVK